MTSEWTSARRGENTQPQDMHPTGILSLFLMCQRRLALRFVADRRVGGWEHGAKKLLPIIPCLEQGVIQDHWTPEFERGFLSLGLERYRASTFSPESVVGLR